MGKRDQRRKRQRAKQKAIGVKRAHSADPKPTVPERVLYPSADEPLIEVNFRDGITDEAKALCRAYWEFTEPGTWARNVAEIGSTTFVYRTVRTACEAALLTLLCPKCTAPVTVTSRSEMSATGHWGESFPRGPITARAACRECRAAAQSEAAAAAALEQQRTEEMKQRKIENASKWLARSLNSEEPSSYPTPQQALGLLAIAEILQSSSLDSLSPLKSLNYTITGSAGGDIDLCREMFEERWLAATTPTKLDAFTFDDDGNPTGLYVDAVSWTFPHWLGSTAREATATAATMLSKYLTEHADTVQDIRKKLEASMTVEYLEDLLTTRYNESPIPENRLPDAYDIALRGLQGGYAFEQMLAMAWSAASASVSWGQRTPGLKSGAVSSGSVTNFERQLGFTRDRPVPHYKLPNSVPRPALYSTAIRFLTEHEEAESALAAFRTVHQRINSRDARMMDGGLVEPDGDVDEEPFDQNAWLDSLLKGREPVPDRTPIMAFAIVTPSGDLAIKEDTTRQMRETAGLMTEELPLDGTASLDALVPVFEDKRTHQPNPVAARMIELLGGGYGIVNGTVIFFQTSHRNRKPHSLDDDHLELVRSAHAAATANPIWQQPKTLSASHPDDLITDCAGCGRQIYGPGLCKECQVM
ncbi:hypothetical protein [Streptomyces sp. NPDC047024]|uniref:hypothetical protein n=1 Tax=Streptomyces sp. NPDC047024 TaxID=3155476 RepID=UPI00340DB88E